ncbi:GNAT family N-acetyltransferase [Konateibacter massiliensis]|uniref:GNAT family N-acetyltransferase n=1 Tax=Konateibacter massiliensis TaxID=2002841 RepID=UPI000C148404|nr:GNAT family N-acetyltransferase [Konateibacter massiliensis]
MIFEEKKITCRDGRSCILRSPRIEDAPELVKYLKQTAMETPYLMREADEVTVTLEQEEEFIKRQIEAERGLMLLAEVDGKNAGSGAIDAVSDLKRYSHRCRIAIALYQEYCGLGIGSKLLQTLLETGKSLHYEQAELEVVATNERAIYLYKSLGFEIYATQPNSVKYSDGTYADLLLMMKRL